MASMYPTFLPSYCFNPNDEELVTSYLSKKLGGDGEKQGRVPYYDAVIPTVDLYGGAAAYPWRVCQRLAYPYGMGATEFYCFTPRRQMHVNSARPVRTVGAGTWKANGGDECIYHCGVLVGHKTHLTFKLAPPGSDGLPSKASALVNTHWVMHEYTLENPGFKKTVLCRVRNLKKEYQVEKRSWSPPWWERLQEGCSSVVTVGDGNSKKRKMTSSGDDAVVAPQKLRQRPATAAPLEDEVAYTHDFEQQRQPFVMSVPLAMYPSPVASASASPSPPSSVTATDDGDDDDLLFAKELEAELLVSSEKEGIYHAEASCNITSCCDVLPPHQQEQEPSSDMEEIIASEDRQAGPSHGSLCLDVGGHITSPDVDNSCLIANTEPPLVGDVTTDPVIAEKEEEVDLRPATAAPLEDEVAYTHDFEQQRQPIVMSVPLAMHPSPVASASPSPPSSVTATDDGDDDVLLFAKELEAELLVSSEKEGIDHAEASCNITSCCDVLPLHQQEQEPSSDMEEVIPSEDRQTGPSHGWHCLDADAHITSPDVDNSCLITNTKPPLGGDVTADPIINQFAEKEEEVDLRPSGNPPLLDYGTTGMIKFPPEEGTFPEAGNNCSVPDMQQLYYGNVTLDVMDQAYQFAEEEEDGMLCGYLPLWEWS